MSIPLPNLDDLRWTEMVAEGIAYLPVASPTWTDHNVHDPGRMLIELLAVEAEQDLYWLNRISAEQQQLFLALAGVIPQPPSAANAVVQFQLQDNANVIHVPAGLQIGTEIVFRTMTPLTLVSGRLQTVQSWTGMQYIDWSRRYREGRKLKPFGTNPKPGGEFYLGFSHPLPENEPTHLYFQVDGEKATEAERNRIVEELCRQANCKPAYARIGCKDEDASNVKIDDHNLNHHDVRWIWETWTAEGWTPIPATAVTDKTRHFTLSGAIILTAGSMEATMVGQVNTPQFYLRCRLLDGVYDSAPCLQNVALNGVITQQAIPATDTWRLAAEGSVTGAITVGERTGLSINLDDQNSVDDLILEDSGSGPVFHLLDYLPADGVHLGYLTTDAVLLDPGDGRPNQHRILPEAPQVADSIRIATYERVNNIPNKSQWIWWQSRPNLNSSKAADPHFVFNAETGDVQFGDGQQGRVVPEGAIIIAQYEITHAQVGNVPSNSLVVITDSKINQQLPVIEQLQTTIVSITNRLPAWGGASGETLGQAMVRARRSQSQRAVTLADYLTLAKETPGVHVARVEALANIHPALPSAKAPGVVTLIVLPELPVERPYPSDAMRKQIAAYLAPRRVVGTRIEIIGPKYTVVHVKAEVLACTGVNRSTLPDKIIMALDRYFHPLHGGSEGSGWPFGRDVYLTELYQVIDDVSGVDHVLSLALLDEDGKENCGNLCIGPFGLVQSGRHEITVTLQEATRDKDVLC